VLRIPRGRVSTYGRIAKMTPVPRGARGVGWALAGLSDDQAQVVPWWRVINAAGRISNDRTRLQRELQARVVFDERGYVAWGAICGRVIRQLQIADCRAALTRVRARLNETSDGSAASLPIARHHHRHRRARPVGLRACRRRLPMVAFQGVPSTGSR
jgi:methylated-DNA-protein-cysteine methyltransferase-like protein